MIAMESLDDLATASDASAMLGIPAGTIRQWASRKHLTPSGLDERNRPMYRLIDVLRVERDTRRRTLGVRAA